MNTSQSYRQAAIPLALAGVLTMSSIVRAQTDNFDSYSTVGGFTAGGWVLSQMAPGFVTTTFPVVGSGKGLRIQSEPIGGVVPAAGIWYRTTEYTNFYMAADLVNWADKNQSFVLLARGAIGDDPGEASGYLVNYNVAQWGDTPTSPRQGELQISVLSAPFSTEQLAQGAITLVQGGSYRFVFSGVGHHFTVRVYDLQDLTMPLISMEADDPGNTYAHGVCGIMSFSRDDAHGVTDITVDNYEIQGFDPNPATFPALFHPVPGTPVIETRIPAERFRNRHNPASGINFTANTHSTNVINAAATKLRLNGVDVSGQLALSPNGPQISGSLPGSALAAHTVYSAQIEVQDVSGLKKSTNTFWFDTFSDSFLSSVNVKVIEVEDYNYSNGLHQVDPIPISGYDLLGYEIGGGGVGYFTLKGVEGVDFHDNRSAPEPLWAGEYRMLDPVGLSQGMFPEVEDSDDPYGEYRYSDFVRTQYAATNMLEHVVHRTEPGEWLNYTRNFVPGNYHAWLRVASLGSSEVSLDRVTSDPTSTGQTTTNLGRFSIPNQFTRYNYRYIPLVDNSSSPVVLHLANTNTLRLTMSGTAGQDIYKLAINYILFSPAPLAIHVLSSATLNGLYTEETGAVVDVESRSIAIPALGSSKFYKLHAEMALTIRGITVSGGIITLKY